MNEKILAARIKLIDNISKPLKSVNEALKSTKKATESVTDTLKDNEKGILTAKEAMKQYEKQQKEAEEATKKYNESVKEASSTFRKMGTALLGVATTSIAYATKQAIEFESAFAGVKKTVSATDAELSKIKEGLKDLSEKMPQSAVELAAIAESAGQLGIETKNILKFTETMAMLGDTTNLGSEDAATSFARFANIVGMSQDDFDRLGSTVVALGNNLATTESEITAMAMRLAGAGAQIGLSEAQILSFAGALSSVGIEAEAGGTAFSKVMSSMQLAVETGNDSLKDFAKVAGMTTSEFKKAFNDNASKAIMTFIEGLGDTQRLGMSTTAILSEMGIEEVRLTDALKRASNASEVFNKALGIGSQAWEENIALTKEAEERYNTVESQIKTLKNQINNIFGDIGESFLPVVQNIVDKIREITTEFKNLDPELKENIAKFTLIAGAVGGVLLVIGMLSPIITGVTLVLGALGTVCGIVAGVFTFLCTPVGAIIGIILAVHTAVVLLKEAWEKNWFNIKDKTQIVIDFIKSKIESIKNTFETVKSKCYEFVESIKNMWQGIKDSITNNPIVATVTKVVNSVTGKDSNKGQKSAWGTKRVVGNDVPYRLHDGERVLTRAEADRYDKGLNTQGINITINGLTVREEADVKKIANQFVRELKIARIAYCGAY